MGTLHLKRRAARWGNGYGIRLTKGEMAKLGVGPESSLDIEVKPDVPAIDISKLHMMKSGRRDLSTNHDDIGWGP